MATELCGGRGRAPGSCQHWLGLQSHLAGLASQDQRFRLRTLKSLSSFLLCITSSANDAASSAPGNGIQIVLGCQAVVIHRQDVLGLYEVLFKEFANLSSLLSFKSALDSADDVYAQMLCCCIRIIPVVDMFNTGLSYSASIAVTEMLHQLRSLTNISPAGQADNGRHIAFRTALLEVFMNEILLHQDLSCPFLQAGDELEQLLANGNECAAFNRQYQAPIEAAFAHMLHHHLLKGHAAAEQRLIRTSKLSLPAGVLLLDIVTVAEIPNSFLNHVVSLVTGALVTQDPTAGGGTRYLRDRNRDRPDHVTESEDLPPVVAIGLAASVVETAMGLLSKHYSASIKVNLAAPRSCYAAECSTLTFSCSGANDDDYLKHGPLVPTLLRAVACAVERIVGEVSKIKQRLSPTDVPEVLESAVKRVMESVAGAFSFNMPSVKCLEVIGCFDQSMIETLASGNSRGAIGWTLVFFAHVLCYESQRGLEEVLAAGYLGVLDALVGLLFLENDCWQQDLSLSTNFFLHTAVKPLQRAVWDMSSHKKPVSNLLEFISKLTPAVPSSPSPLAEKHDSTEREASSRLDVQNCSVEASTVRADVVPVNPRPSTLAIVKRLQKRTRTQSAATERCAERFEDDDCSSRGRKRTRGKSSQQFGQAAAQQVDNPFIAEMMKRDKYEESFEDLKDFIVCKKGRDYTKFYELRIKYRRKNHTRLIWKRREEKQQLLRLLDLSAKDAGFV